MKYLIPAGGVIDTRFGILTSPGHKGIPKGIIAGMEWAADLGALEGPEYVRRYAPDSLEWLGMMEPYRGTCLFVSGMDCVGDARKTLENFPVFQSALGGWPVAFVAQDGQEDLPLPGGDWTALFIGGSTAWKDGPGALECVRKAQAIGKRIHIGRVNEWARFRNFAKISGSEEFTCDGTKQRFVGVDRAIKHYARQMERAKRQIYFDLFGGNRGG